MDMTVGQIAQLVGGDVLGDAETRITGVNGIREAQPGELTFIRAARYQQYLATTKASAVLVSDTPDEAVAIPIIRVSAPDLAFAQVLQHCSEEQTQHPEGIHETAVVGKNVQLGEGVALDAHVRIADDCVIGDGVVLYAGVYVGRGCVIGDNTVVYPNVVLREETEVGARCVLHAGASIGSDGFGFAPLGGRWMKIPQVGRVVIGDDVEVGANTTIDRATFGITRVGQGTKIDNQVQIGHNVELGEHCAIAGMVGIAGSAIVGDHVRVGASAGIGGHIDIGAHATIGARAGVNKSVKPEKIVSGFPAVDHTVQRRIMVAQQKTPEMLRRIRQLERKLQALEELLNEQAADHS